MLVFLRRSMRHVIDCWNTQILNAMQWIKKCYELINQTKNTAKFLIMVAKIEL